MNSTGLGYSISEKNILPRNHLEKIFPGILLLPAELSAPYKENSYFLKQNLFKRHAGKGGAINLCQAQMCKSPVPKSHPSIFS